mmetsp:Transcript_27887/g.24535  ORF Transcript_27887/g.24535 Transcript_27887/m.24535 type:complete len:118 (+) Transcript_27887:1243-1596(+)
MLDMKTACSQEEYLDTYNQVNQIIADKVYEYSEANTLIIIQDYPLLMVPHYICSKDHKLSISFYFESPFPSLDIVRTLTNKKQILDSLLCCDLICFNTSEYLKIFSSVMAKFYGTSL